MNYLVVGCLLFSMPFLKSEPLGDDTFTYGIVLEHKGQHVEAKLVEEKFIHLCISSKKSGTNSGMCVLRCLELPCGAKKIDSIAHKKGILIFTLQKVDLFEKVAFI